MNTTAEDLAVLIRAYYDRIQDDKETKNALHRSLNERDYLLRSQAELQDKLASCQAQKAELLAALQSCLDFWSGPPSGLGCNSQRKQWLDSIQEKAKAAIANASKI